MNRILILGIVTIGLITISFTLSAASRADISNSTSKNHTQRENIQLGPRPFFLVDDMDAGVLKKKLEMRGRSI